MLNITENVATNLLRLKQIKDKTIDEIAVGVRMGNKKIHRFLHRKQSPKINELEAIAEYFEVCPIDFMTKKL